MFQVWLSYLHTTGSALESGRCRPLPGAASHDHDGDEEQTSLPGFVQLDRRGWRAGASGIRRVVCYPF